jgi:co-chaperonin GroES (HSP10)
MVIKREQTDETPLDRALRLKHKAPPKVFTPIGSDICCYFFEQKEVFTSGGLLLPDTAKDRWHNTIAVVIAIGPKCEYVKEGDIILVKGGEYSEQLGAPVKYAQSIVSYDDKKYQVFPEYMVAGILYHPSNEDKDEWMPS